MRPSGRQRIFVALVAAAVTGGRPGRAGADPPAPPAPAATDPTFEPLLVVTEPRALAALEAGGLDAGTLALGRKGASSLAELAGGAGWRSITGVLRADIAEIYARDARYGVGMRYTHRGFDPAWLSSPAVRLELVAVVNRIDRRVFHPGTCGELRFVYRMAYRAPTKDHFSSRLPFTVNVVFFLPDDGQRCAGRARSLARPEDIPPLVRAGLTLKSVEVNLQTSRWPSTIRPDLGGHAEYLLRVFHFVATPGATARLVPAPMENMPDVDRIRVTPVLREALAAWLRKPGVLDKIDDGTALLPERLLATRALSVTPRGLARPANAPFRRLLPTAELADLALAGRRHIRSPEALLRRLDALTCVGCHQSRSLAGFHIVGAERDPARVVDALAVALSPHLVEDLPRRRAYLRALAAGRVPDETRPPAERGSSAGTFGHACGLGDPGFAAWTCAAGLDCVAVDDDRVGQCMPRAPRAGAACQPGPVSFESDRIRAPRTLACGPTSVCEDTRVGFPGGMCASLCAALGPGDACGAIALLTPFNNCLARGTAFAECAKLARPAGLAACDARNPCRPDYLCARTPDGGNGCLPPYFVLQMRVDGHPASIR